VPVAVGAAVEQQDLGSACAQRRQRVEEGLGEELGRTRVVAMQEDDQQPAVAPRHDEDLVQVATGQSAMQGEADEFRGARRVVGLSVAARGGERRGNHG